MQKQPVMPSTSNTGLQIQPIRYRDWIITTKVVDRRLWLRWQHPKENFPRYSYPVTERGLADTIRYARFLIDLAIQLEAAAADHELKHQSEDMGSSPMEALD